MEDMVFVRQVDSRPSVSFLKPDSATHDVIVVLGESQWFGIRCDDEMVKHGCFQGAQHHADHFSLCPSSQLDGRSAAKK